MTNDHQTSFDTLVTQVNQDPALIHRGRFVDAVMLIGLDDEHWSLRIGGGRITDCQSTDSRSVEALLTDEVPDSAFLLQAPAAEWQRFWMALPPPGSHDLFALLKRRVLVTRGDLHPFMANLMYFKIVLAKPRLMKH